MHIPHFGRLLGGVAGLLLIYILSIHFWPEGGWRSREPSFRKEVTGKTVVNGETTVPATTRFWDPAPSAGSPSGTGNGAIAGQDEALGVSESPEAPPEPRHAGPDLQPFPEDYKAGYEPEEYVNGGDLELRLARMDEAMAALYDLANEDRLEALLKLWRAAADAGVPEEALVELDWVTYDPDPEIAQYAARAMEDLERLRDSLTAEP